MRVIAKTVIVTVIIFLLMQVSGVVFALALIGGLPTDAYIYPVRNYSFYTALWHSSPWDLMSFLLVDKAILIIEHRDAENGMQVWGMYYFGLSLIAHVTVSILASYGWVSGRLRSTGKHFWLLVVSLSLVWFSTSYMQSIACCGNGPGWLADVWLLTYVYNPFSSADFQSLYQLKDPWFLIVQIVMFLSGTILLLRAWLNGGNNES